MDLTPSVLERCPRCVRSHVGRDVVVGIRPEDFEDAALVAEANGCCLDVDVALAEPMGSEVIAHFPLGQLARRPVEPARARRSAGRLRLDPDRLLSPRSSARAGRRLRLAVDVDRLHFFDEETEQALS